MCKKIEINFQPLYPSTNHPLEKERLKAIASDISVTAALEVLANQLLVGNGYSIIFAQTCC